MSILVLRTGDAIAEVAETRGQFSRWIRDAVGDAWSGEWREHDVRTDAELPGLDGLSGVVITGSSSSVTERAPWMLRTEEYLRTIHRARIPILGICFGHQILAQALGGNVEKNPRGREVGTVTVRRVRSAEPFAEPCAEPSAEPCVELAGKASHPLFDGLGDEFAVNATHVDSVIRLPDGARLLCATDLEPHAAYEIGGTSLGVQFHPEIDGEVMRAYVRARAQVISSEGLCHKTIHDRVHEAPEGMRILRNFVHHYVRPGSRGR